MGLRISIDRARFVVKKLREKLWLRPLVVCLLSIAAAFAANLFDGSRLDQYTPAITRDSVEELLSIMASSMLVIATLSVASMVSAYAAASNTATPRAFTLVVADDSSQNALSAFTGAFIYSVVALTAAKNDLFEASGLFVLFLMTAFVFAFVIFTFVHWVDCIARLGRLPSTIDKVEKATADALVQRRRHPNLCAHAVRSPVSGNAVYSAMTGYVQHLDIQALQTWAAQADARVVVAALPGTFVTPDRPLALITEKSGSTSEDVSAVTEAFRIGTARRFDDDPRFGLVVLSEIAGRALSPGINDPGTAIDIIGRLVRLLNLWCAPAEGTDDTQPLMFDRVEVPALSEADMFDDAFTAIARDGAGHIEVAIRLQKAFCSLAATGDQSVREAARRHQKLALARCETVLKIPEDLAAVRAAADFDVNNP